MWQLWLHGGSFGIKDPQFHRDISFYAWDYPVYRSLLGFGFTAVIFSLILSIGVHYLTGAIRLQTPGPKVTLAARRHLTILVFVFMALKAIAYWLDRYGLVFSNRSKFTGASYTDVHSVLPAKTILFWIAIILALGVLASIWLRSVLLPGIGFAVLLVLSILISGIYPAIVQQVSVKPNASDKEAPYILRNITATREAYGIKTADPAFTNGGEVRYHTYPVAQDPARSEVTTANTTVDNIRITDPNIVSPTVTNEQKIRQVYGFPDKLNVDRYTIDGVEHDYIVGVRAAEPGLLQDSQRNWINEHTAYTHGYGFVAAQASVDITKPGAQYAAGDIPPNPPSGPLTPRVPQVYYGQLMSDYAIVGAQGSPREYDGDGSQRVTYAGAGGVSLGGFFTKLAFAIKYKETNFLLNDAVSASGAKIIFNRDPKTIVEKVAPFLTVDGDPYPFVDSQSGHIMWMVDGYTTMANYPYSERQSLSDLTHTSLRQGQKDTQINYIRNSVKATVDAYDGTVKLYAWGQDDPVLKAWMSVFPGLISPASAMPASVQTHVRYPQDLFDVQRALLAQYHVDDPIAFYNGSDRWAVPDDPFSPGLGQQPPYYVLANSPGAADDATVPQFQLTSPMRVNNSQNLAAYISADSDPGADYGRLTVLRVSDPAAVQGPAQVANTFRTDTTIAANIKLLSGGGNESSVIHGNLLTLPLGKSFLYVEPLYAASTYPTLQRVLVSYGNNLGFGATLADALSDFEPGKTLGHTLNTPGTGIQNGSGSGSPTSTPTQPSGSNSSSAHPPPSTSVDQLLDELATAQANLNAAYDTHDAAKIGAAQAARDAIVEQLIAAGASNSPSAPAPSPTK
jgi:uncharacterized membrane protein (UPF0182 family)